MKENYIELFNEATITMITFHLYLCSDFIESDDLKYNIGWSIVVITLANILVNNIFLVQATYKSIRELIQKIKERCNKRKLKKYDMN
jgi:hypothetical protein